MTTQVSYAESLQLSLIDTTKGYIEFRTSDIHHHGHLLHCVHKKELLALIPLACSYVKERVHFSCTTNLYCWLCIYFLCVTLLEFVHILHNLIGNLTGFSSLGHFKF